MSFEAIDELDDSKTGRSRREALAQSAPVSVLLPSAQASFVSGDVFGSTGTEPGG